VAALLRASLIVYHARSSSPTEPTVKALARRLRLPAANVAVEEGDARLLIPEFLSARGAQLLVLGAISRGPVQRVLIGSTAEDILDRLSCDALIVKPRRAPSRRRR
jgi:universal stress protein E